MSIAPCIAFVAGKSGGHIIPGLTLAKQYQEKNSGSKIIFFTTHSELDAKIMKQAPMGTVHIPLTLRNASLNPFRIVLFIAQFMSALCVSIQHLKRSKPERVVSMGGYISLPVCLAAKILKIPIELYELNVVPGKAVKIIAPLATTISICFEATKPMLPAKKCVIRPYPIRFNATAKERTQEDIVQKLCLPIHKKTVFIHGGSQGSVTINSHIRTWLELNPHVHSLINIIHQTGGHNTSDWKSLYAHYEIPAIVFDFSPEMQDYYQAADVIVSRAGAGAIFEVLFFEKPCIVIPLYARSTSHQIDNARAIAKQYPHWFTVITEEQIQHDNLALFSVLNKLLHQNSASPTNAGLAGKSAVL